MEHCRQCGTCCRKGGPAIHQEDKQLLEKGHIALKYLFTIRKDEPVYDNVQGCIICAPSDIIRIKSRESSSSCIFFNPEFNACTIYDNRPLECRILECWNTHEIETIYDTGRLSRCEILSNTSHIKDLVEYHENRCAYRIIKELVHQLNQDNDVKILESIREMLAFDKHYRLLCVEKSICTEDMIDFLFGLSLEKTLPRMGLKIIRKFTKHEHNSY